MLPLYLCKRDGVRFGDCDLDSWLTGPLIAVPATVGLTSGQHRRTAMIWLAAVGNTRCFPRPAPLPRFHPICFISSISSM